MRAVCALVVYLASASSVSFAQEVSRLRPVDPWASETIDRAVTRSAVVRGLVQTLEASNVIVHVATSATLPREVAGTTRFVTGTGGYRYVRIDLERSLPPDARAAILGHELQHACEIASSGAASEEAVRELFDEIGSAIGGAVNAYETKAAAETTVRVWKELRSGRSVVALKAAEKHD